MALTRPRPLRLDGRFFRRGGRRTFLKAVTYGPFPPGNPLDPHVEFPRIAAAGFNAIRIYEAPSQALLDCAAAHDLMVIAGLHWPWTQDFISNPRVLSGAELTYVRFLAAHGNHPSLAAVLVGNEIPPDLVRWLGPANVRQTVEHLIDVCRAEAPHLLVAYANFPTTEYLEPRNADFTAFNLYLEQREPLARYLRRLQNIAGDRPVLITEFGLDTIRHDEDEQRDILDWHFRECLEAGIAGTTIYAWSDLWFTDDRTVTDWALGLTRADGGAKSALEHLGHILPAIESPRDVLRPGETPKVSIVVCTHNGASRLGDCLSACLSIDYPDYEVLVVDDGSTDTTREVVDSFPEVRCLHQDHAGLSAARNHGAREAHGEIIAYTDDDCEPDRDWLFWLVRAFDDPRVAAAGGPNLPPAPDGLQEAVVAAGPGAPSHVLLTDTRAEHLPGCNLAIRREALGAVRGFREQYRTAGDDVDLCWRLLDAGWQLAFAPAAFVWHRRRTSFLRYLKQQWGYGRAEALLYADHSDRFGSDGFRWEGAIYAGGPVSADAHAVIYHGHLGTAPFQSIASRVMPRRLLDRRFDGAFGSLLLAIADWWVPHLRGWSRWRHGGPFPRFRRAPRPVDLRARFHPRSGGPLKVYRDDLRDTTKLAFHTHDPAARLSFLHHLRSFGWATASETEGWDLKRRPDALVTVLERLGPESYILRIHLRHTPGHKRALVRQLQTAALDIGLELES